MKRRIYNYLEISFALISALVFLQASAQAHPKETPELLDLGKRAYKQQCAVCHGSEGKGDGEAAYLLFPKPRDFTIGSFKVRSTPSGESPLDQNLFNTISKGMPGSAMAGFKNLSERERWALVYYIKKFSQLEEVERVIKTAAPPAPTPDLLARGREVYRKLKCWECHGDYGRADGPSAPTLKDDLGYPIPPNDFTQGIYKGGGRPQDIYLRFTTGMDGTPMPSFEDSATEEERWALVYYVKSLAGVKVVVQPSTGKITAKKVSGALSLNPLDPAWNNVKAVSVPLMLLWQRQQSASQVWVRAVHNGDELALLVEWEDNEVNGSFIRHQDFTDSAALMFSLSSPPPHFTMGQKGKPVNIWYWRLDKQMDLGGFKDMEAVYPGMWWNWYPLEKGFGPGGVRDARGPMSPALAHNPTFITGWGAGNILSNPFRTKAVEDLNAEGFGTLTAQPLSGQNVSGLGYWVNGKWRIIFKRSLNPSGSYDVKLGPGSSVPIAFAVWDGARNDRDGQKAITTWYTLELIR